ncbi:HET-E [Fusarium albosuccineum]|uniref:HET-E n=1 Tax=Fusarium albosuccineum TaxID=1237068 RepID=A0A8H4KJT7_9HYPO|nr:HET-E [Fusarium albosuccineum]
MVIKVTFSPDGQLLASSNLGSSDIKLWDTTRGCQIATLPGHERVIQSFSFSPDSRRLAAPSSGGNAKVWELPVTIPNTSKHSLPAFYHYRSKPIFSDDGLKLAFPWQQSKLGTWDAALIEPSWFCNLMKNLPLGQELYFATSPTRGLLAVSAASTLVVWDLKLSSCVSTLTCPNFGSENSLVRSIKFLKDGFHLLVGTQHRQMILSDTSGKIHKKIRAKHGPIWAMETIITDTSELLILSSGRSVNILDFTDLENPTYVCSLDLGGIVLQLLRGPGCDSTIYTPLGVLDVDISVESYDEAVKSYFRGLDLKDEASCAEHDKAVLWMMPELRSHGPHYMRPSLAL